MLKKILTYTFLAILAGYMLFAMVIIPNIPDRNKCKGVLITVENDESGNLSNDNIIELLDNLQHIGTAAHPLLHLRIQTVIDKFACHSGDRLFSCRVYIHKYYLVKEREALGELPVEVGSAAV